MLADRPMGVRVSHRETRQQNSSTPHTAEGKQETLKYLFLSVILKDVSIDNLRRGLEHWKKTRLSLPQPQSILIHVCS
jgi:hypothetical protein